MFFHRLLLLHVKGVRSFTDIRTVVDQSTGENIVCESFLQAAIYRGIATTDNKWKETMDEAIQHQMPHQIQIQVASFLQSLVPSNCCELWSILKGSMSEDLLTTMAEAQASSRALLEIEEILLTHNTS